MTPTNKAEIEGDAGALSWVRIKQIKEKTFAGAAALELEPRTLSRRPAYC